MNKRLRTTLSGVTIIVGALAASSPAWSWGGLTLPAQNAASTPRVSTDAPANAPVGSLIQLGAPGLGSVGQAGYGNGVPLSLALGMLVPVSWASNTVGVDPSALVTWTDRQSWPQALGQIAKEKGWTIVLDWTGHTVTVEAAKQSPVKPLTNLAQAKAALVSPHAAAKPAAPKPVPAPASLSLVPGKPLGEQLREQGRAQGWTVIWNVDQDWIVPSATTLTGSFVDAVGAAINALAANGADIRADIYAGNHTIVIHPAGGEQTAGASTGDSN